MDLKNGIFSFIDFVCELYLHWWIVFIYSVLHVHNSSFNCVFMSLRILSVFLNKRVSCDVFCV